MPKRSSKKLPPDDPNVAASEAVRRLTETDEGPTEAKPAPKPTKRKKNPHAVALGRKGGIKGGRARAEKLTPEERRKIAKRAAKARWTKQTRDHKSPTE